MKLVEIEANKTTANVIFVLKRPTAMERSSKKHFMYLQIADEELPKLPMSPGRKWIPFIKKNDEWVPGGKEWKDYDPKSWLKNII